MGDPWMAAAAAAVLAIPVWLLRAADLSGCVAGFLAAFLFALDGGIVVVSGFVLLVVLGTAASRVGRAAKVRLGAAQAAGGRRSARHVVANAGVAVLALEIGRWVPAMAEYARVAALGALAGSLTDTVSGEIGMLVRTPPRLLLLGPRVAPGTDGGMTFFGLGVGATAAAAAALMAWSLDRSPAPVALPVFIGGMVGTLADSLLGASLERRGVLGNEAVNFLASGCAAAAAGMLREVLR